MINMAWFGNSQLGTAQGIGEFTQEDRVEMRRKLDLLQTELIGISLIIFIAIIYRIR